MRRLRRDGRVLRRFAFRRRLPQTIAVGVVAVALVVGFVVASWLPAVGVVLALAKARGFGREAEYDR